MLKLSENKYIENLWFMPKLIRWVVSKRDIEKKIRNKLIENLWDLNNRYEIIKNEKNYLKNGTKFWTNITSRIVNQESWAWTDINRKLRKSLLALNSYIINNIKSLKNIKSFLKEYDIQLNEQELDSFISYTKVTLIDALCKWNLSWNNVNLEFILSKLPNNIMKNYFDQFQLFLDSELLRLSKEFWIETTNENILKTRLVVNELWKFDLRKLITQQIYYPLIIRNILCSLINTQKIKFVQFSCTNRIQSKDQYWLIDTSPQWNNILPNVPFLLTLEQIMKNIWVEIEIVVIFADSENKRVDTLQWKKYWISSQQLENDLSFYRNEALDRLKIQLKTYWLESTNICSAISLENKTMFDWTSFETNFNKLLNWDLTWIIDNNIISLMSCVWKNVDNWNQKNAFIDAEEEIINNPTLQWVDEVYIEKAKRQLVEYALQWKMLELMYPNIILLQNEKPASIKNSFYQPLRTQKLPEINPYSF